MDIETEVKLAIYSAIARTAAAPTVGEVASALGLIDATVAACFQGLFAKRLLVLEPGSSRILMAPPFSAIPTPFRVLVDGTSYFANCVWDALGIPAAFHKDAEVQARCGDCEAPMSLAVRGGAAEGEECIIHFAVPAARWWDDIRYT